MITTKVRRRCIAHSLTAFECSFDPQHLTPGYASTRACSQRPWHTNDYDQLCTFTDRSAPFFAAKRPWQDVCAGVLMAQARDDNAGCWVTDDKRRMLGNRPKLSTYKKTRTVPNIRYCLLWLLAAVATPGEKAVGLAISKAAILTCGTPARLRAAWCYRAFALGTRSPVVTTSLHLISIF